MRGCVRPEWLGGKRDRVNWFGSIHASACWRSAVRVVGWVRDVDRTARRLMQGLRKVGVCECGVRLSAHVMGQVEEGRHVG